MLSAGLNGDILRGVQDLVGVGVADAGDGALVAQHALDLRAARRREDVARTRSRVKASVERVGAEPGDARHVLRRSRTT